jgi:Flp pilus assembly protein TadG
MMRMSACTLRLPSPCAFSAACRRGERGQSIVETTLCMIILLTMLFGIIQAGLAVYSYHFIAEAAREGARYAIVRGSACTSFVTACPATATDIQNYVKGLGFPGIDTRASAMTVTATCGALGSLAACSSSNDSPGNLVHVAITYKFPLAVPFVPAQTITMNTASQMVISQ